MSDDLNTAIGLCRLMGLFPPETASWPVRAAYRTYQTMFFTVVCLVSTSMTIQLFTSPDMRLLARTIDMLTMCWTGLYKWFCMVVFVREFHAFHRLLDATAASQGTARVNGHRLGLIPAVSNAYAFSGFILAIFLSLGAVITYPKGCVYVHHTL